MQIISKTYKEIEIIFSQNFDETLYINATKIAKEFNKDVREWKRSKQTIQYMESLSDVGFSHSTLIKVITGNFNDGREQGTWIHKKLITVFARWLLPDFAVWCDSIIEEILETGSYQIPQSPEKSLKKKTEDLELAVQHYEKIEKIFKKFHNLSKRELAEKTSHSVFLETGIDFLKMFGEFPKENRHNFQNSFSLTSLLEKNNIEIQTYKFNIKLSKIGIIEKRGKNWFILNLDFGKNEDYQNDTYPNYFEDTFQDLLKLVYP